MWYPTKLSNELMHSFWQSTDELYHHGILGMHWGQRNGPPYPLSDGAHSPSEKKAGWKKSLGGGKTSSVGKDEHGILAALAVISATYVLPFVPLAIAAGVEKHKDKKAEKFREKCNKEREEAPVEKKTGLKRQVTEKSLEENVKRVNPDYRLEGNNGKINCVNCSMTLELRRRGYEVSAQTTIGGKNGFEVAKQCFPKSKNTDVVARPKVDLDKKGNPKSSIQVDEWNRFWNSQEKKVQSSGGNKELAKQAVTALKGEEPGSRGQVLVSWNRRSGHSMGYEVTPEGKVQIIDSQVNKIYNEKEAEKMLRRTCSFSYQRLDNSPINVKKLKECVR